MSTRTDRENWGYDHIANCSGGGMIKGVRYVSVMACVMGISAEAVAMPENISSMAPLTFYLT